jgi:ABC-type multidrug transport system fused ATPase/permease subunit
MLGVASIMPLIAMITSPDYVFSNEKVLWFYKVFNFDDERKFAVIFTLILFIFQTIRALFGIFFSYALNKKSFSIYNSVATRLLKIYLRQDYIKFTNRNSADFIKAITEDAQNITSIIQALLRIIAEAFVLLFVYLMLIIFNLSITLLVTLILGIVVTLITKKITPKIKIEGHKKNDIRLDIFKLLNKAFSNFKTIRIMRVEDVIFKDFGILSRGFSRVGVTASVYSQLPKIIMEYIGYVIIFSIIIFSLMYEGTFSMSAALISVFAVSLHRMLPAVTKIVNDLNLILFMGKSVDIVNAELKIESASVEPGVISFNKSIVLDGVSFSYNSSNEIIKDFNLVIRKGEKVAIIGESGIGKSTIADLIVGLIGPASGKVKVDNVVLDEKMKSDWNKRIGYISQNIYLFDGTVAENVSFGRVYSEGKVMEALRKAKILDFVMAEGGLQNIVGEGGIRLSGGQRQRIGIARVLYSDIELLILDEATSALDAATELEIMREIYSLVDSMHLTMIIITHRLSIISGCDKIINLSDS